MKQTYLIIAIVIALIATGVGIFLYKRQQRLDTEKKAKEKEIGRAHV